MGVFFSVCGLFFFFSGECLGLMCIRGVIFDLFFSRETAEVFWGCFGGRRFGVIDVGSICWYACNLLARGLCFLVIGVGCVCG